MDTIVEIRKVLKQNATEEHKASALKFIPDGKKILGVKMPVLNELAKKFKDADENLILELWKEGIYEERILAAKIIGKIAKKKPETAISLLTKFSVDIDNWALCDTLGMQSLKPIVKSHAKEIFLLSEKYITSKKMWQRRLALVLVEWHCREKEFKPAIKALLKKVEGDNEYYIKKAVVWINASLNKKR
jgi:3-methyladenine DNA glycosylase AlkD